MSISAIRNFGALCAAQLAATMTAVTAAGAGDATKITGASINRLGFGSCKVVVPYRAVLAQTKTLSLAVEIQDSSDDSLWDTAEVLQASTAAATGETGGSTEEGVISLDVDLAAYKQYVRFNVTPDLNASGTDTAIVGAVCILGGADSLPIDA